MNEPSHILVDDDEPDLELLIRQKFRRQIRDGRMTFSFAGDGMEALERLRENADIGILLTDINMPRMDGLTLLGKLTDLDRLLKTVVVAAYGDIGNIRTAMNRGGFDFVTKPVNFDDLTVTLERTRRELEALRQAAAVARQWTALNRELEIASKIQLSMLPPAFPAFPDAEAFDLCATILPAQEVGGDLYDCFLLDDDRLGFVIGDVAGKGIGAAIFIAITRTMLRATALRGSSPAACLREVNRVLHPESMAHLFVTLIYGVLDVRTGSVALCNAGHNLPYVVRKGGGVEAVNGARAGALPGRRLRVRGALTLKPGDGLVLYTDGVTEAVDKGGGRFEEERLVVCLERAGQETPAETIRDVLRALEAFSGGAPQADDITLLALRYNGDAVS